MRNSKLFNYKFTSRVVQINRRSLFNRSIDGHSFSSIIDENGESMSYLDLKKRSWLMADQLRSQYGHMKTAAIYGKSGSDFVVSLLSLWLIGVAAAPVHPNYPVPELLHILETCKPDIIIKLRDTESIPIPVGSLPPIVEYKLTPLQETNEQRKISIRTYGNMENALIIFTSGTTGKPKAVIHTFHGLQHMTQSLVDAWQISNEDVILHFLPLNHMHGLLNKLLCLLHVGGTVRFLPNASPSTIWKYLASPHDKTNSPKPTLFMAVPTVYAKLLESMDELPETDRENALRCIRDMRLMTCGSAPLPTPLLSKWKERTGHVILERYGMSEFGMALSNPYKDGVRVPGSVGFPLPFVQCRVVPSEDGAEERVAENGDQREDADMGSSRAGDKGEDQGRVGELRIKGPTVFKEYLNQPEVTVASFDSDGWFKTGDIVRLSPDGSYSILGRQSTDIIKTSGYKVSALEIERAILGHPQIADVAVVGAPDPVLGETVTAVIALKSPSPAPTPETSESHMSVSSGQRAINSEDSQRVSAITADNATELLRIYLTPLLAPYKVPRSALVTSAIPRNALGKVNKKTLLGAVMGNREDGGVAPR